MACSRARITRAFRASPLRLRCSSSQARWAGVGRMLIGCRVGIDKGSAFWATVAGAVQGGYSEPVAAAHFTMTHDPTPPPSGPRRFAAPPRRVIDRDGRHILDAVDPDGRAWWLVRGVDEAPDDWTELRRLPTYQEQP